MLSQQHLLLITALLATLAVLQHIDQLGQWAPYHNLILTRENWLIELISSHNQNRFYEQLGLSKNVFLELVKELENLQLIEHTKYMSTEEQVAIFLYTVMTNLLNRKVAK